MKAEKTIAQVGKIDYPKILTKNFFHIWPQSPFFEENSQNLKNFLKKIFDFQIVLNGNRLFSQLIFLSLKLIIYKIN